MPAREPPSPAASHRPTSRRTSACSSAPDGSQRHRRAVPDRAQVRRRTSSQRRQRSRLRREGTNMKKSIAATALAAGIITGPAVALTAPGIALAADSTTNSSSATDRAASRLTAIKDALKDLVTDGSITQAQADKVATTLSQADVPFGGPGGRGPHGPGMLSPDATAAAIGITADELRTGVLSGKTLTQIA